ncbi:hypothetical protein H4582DRAFT_2079079 [Lactarius indigo]|nr:hypothetical protein H4582DRAFT_2079079 [Lactarius indigo]
MPLRRPGSVYLSCRAVLQNPRIVDDIWCHVFFDATIFCSVALDNNSREVVGSLRYEVKKSNEIVSSGLYDIDAKVVAYEPSIHEQNSVRAEEEFVFMGDLLELRPVSDAGFYQVALDVAQPARLFTFGTVIRLDRDIDTFTVEVFQTVTGSSPLAHLNVRGAVGINVSREHRSGRLPPLNCTIFFTGDIMMMDDGVAIVAVDDLTYMPRPCLAFIRTQSNPVGDELPNEFDIID